MIHASSGASSPLPHPERRRLRAALAWCWVLGACGTPTQQTGTGFFAADASTADAGADAGLTDVAPADTASPVDATPADIQQDAAPADTAAFDTAVGDAVMPADAVDGETPDAADAEVATDASPAGPDSVGPDAGTPQTIIRVQHPKAASLQLRGDTAPLSWTSSMAPTSVNGTEARFVLPPASGPIQVKPVLQEGTGDPVWSIGANYLVQPAAERVIHPYFDPKHAAGRRENFEVKAIGDPKATPGPRTVRVFLPPGYDENTLAHYPLLLMWDAQNVFEDATATFAVAWKAQDALMKSLAAGKLTEVVIAAVDHGGKARIHEYTPWADSKEGGGGGENTMKWIDTTVLPELDQRYRLLPGRDNRIVGGSSLGGIMSLYAALTRPKTFGGGVCMSGAWWWADEQSLTFAKSELKAALPTRLWVDAGTVNDGLPLTQKLRDLLLSGGLKLDETLGYYEHQGADHSEGAWQKRVHLALEFFFDRGDRAPAF